MHHSHDRKQELWKQIYTTVQTDTTKPCAEVWQQHCHRVPFPLWKIPTAAAQTLSLAGLRKHAQCCRWAVCDILLHPCPATTPAQDGHT